jgi:hypothetical protein
LDPSNEALLGVAALAGLYYLIMVKLRPGTPTLIGRPRTKQVWTYKGSRRARRPPLSGAPPRLSTIQWVLGAVVLIGYALHYSGLWSSLRLRHRELLGVAAATLLLLILAGRFSTRRT